MYEVCNSGWNQCYDDKRANARIAKATSFLINGVIAVWHLTAHCSLGVFVCAMLFSRSPGNYMGDVNISAILDSFSVSYDKRVRPNYGGEYRFVCYFFWAVARPSRGSTTLLRGDVVAIIHTHCQGGAWSMVWGGLPSDAQHLSRPPLRSQPLTGRWRTVLPDTDDVVTSLGDSPFMFSRDEETSIHSPH